MDLLLRGKKSN
jgi:hypothetical protein